LEPRRDDNHVDSTVLPPLLDEWLRIAHVSVGSDSTQRPDVVPGPQQQDAQAATNPISSAFRRVA
jgi:hypothetical protein